MFLSAYGQTLSFEHHVTMMRNNILTSTSQMYQQIIQIIQHFSDLPWSFIVVLIALHRLLHSVPCYNVVFVSTELIDSQDKSSAVASPLDQAIVYACLRMFTHVYACLRMFTHVYAVLEHCPKLETVDVTSVLWSFALGITNSNVDFCFQ